MSGECHCATKINTIAASYLNHPRYFIERISLELIMQFPKTKLKMVNKETIQNKMMKIPAKLYPQAFPWRSLYQELHQGSHRENRVEIQSFL
jgi:hypothetical protein